MELAVENASVWGLRNFANVEDIGLFATNFMIIVYTNNMAPSPMITVAMYTPSPAIVSTPTLATMPTIKPKTANGTIFIAMIRIYNVIFWTDSSKSNNGLTDSFGRAAIARPTIIAIIKILSICPSRYDMIGFLGIMFDAISGISSTEKPSVTFKSSSDKSCVSWSAVRSRMLPGAITDARVIAIKIEIVVVITK